MLCKIHWQINAKPPFTHVSLEKWNWFSRGVSLGIRRIDGLIENGGVTLHLCSLYPYGACVSCHPHLHFFFSVWELFAISFATFFNYFVVLNGDRSLCIEDITWPRGDTNFVFQSWKYLSWVSEANEWEILQHEKIKFVTPSGHVMFYLFYR